MKLKNPLFVVSDMDKSLDFYKKVLGVHVLCMICQQSNRLDRLLIHTQKVSHIQKQSVVRMIHCLKQALHAAGVLHEKTVIFAHGANSLLHGVF